MGAELLVLYLVELEGERFGECGLLPTSDRGSPKDIINTVPIWAAWCMTSGIPPSTSREGGSRGT